MNFLYIASNKGHRCFAEWWLIVINAALPTLSFANPSVTSTMNAKTELVVTADQGAKFQLEVRQMPLAKVLDAIAQQTKVPIHYSVLPDGVITATCVGAALKPVLECLLNRKADLIVRYQKKSAKAENQAQIAEAWILGSRIEASANSALCTATSASGSMTLNYKEPERSTKTDHTDKLLKLAKSGDALARADAISSLLQIGRKDDPQIKEILEQALHDQDASVRAQALSTLTHRGDNEEIIPAAIQEAMQDNSVDVRLMAVDSITDDVGQLQQAVNDSDETVRTLATLKLEQVMQSQKSK